MVDILSSVLTDGIDGVDATCAEALSYNVHSASIRHCARTNGVQRLISQHPRPQSRTAVISDNHNSGCLAADLRGRRRLQPL